MLTEKHMTDAFAYLTGSRRQGKSALRERLLSEAVSHGISAHVIGFDPASQRPTAREVKDLRVGDPPFRGRSLDSVWWDELAKMTQQVPVKPIVAHKPLSEISNADLVMEMLKRGFAVMKLPEDGGPPTALRDG